MMGHPKHEETDDLAGAREALRAKHRELVQNLKLAHERKRDLLAAAAQTDGEIRSTVAKIEAIQNLLKQDFASPPKKRGDDRWDHLPLPAAASEALAEVGCFLTDSQLRAQLARHGVEVEDSGILRQELERHVGPDGKLMRVSSHLWARRDWEDQARMSLPKKKA